MIDPHFSTRPYDGKLVLLFRWDPNLRSMIVFMRTSANVVHCITCTLCKIVHRQNKKMATTFANNSATLMHPNQSISLHARYGYLRPSLRHSNAERRKSLGSLSNPHGIKINERLFIQPIYSFSFTLSCSH